jgi:cytoplasmic iron level regulating protein YaaA (DUF328/UPF0246 family)
MKILFSPSETKFSGGHEGFLNAATFIFPELFEYRKQAIKAYEQYVKETSFESLCHLFGTKKNNIVEYYKQSIYDKPLMKAIQRYDGVAYDYLQYAKLNEEQQTYIDNNVLIFSNLLGPLSAKNENYQY